MDLILEASIASSSIISRHVPHSLLMNANNHVPIMPYMYVTGPGQAFRKQVSLHAISEQMAGEIETGE